MVRILFYNEEIQKDENCEQTDHQLSREILWTKPEYMAQGKNTWKEKLYMYQRTEWNHFFMGTKRRRNVDKQYFLKIFPVQIKGGNQVHDFAISNLQNTI